MMLNRFPGAAFDLLDDQVDVYGTRMRMMSPLPAMPM
jgi:hypothetical protein